MESGSAGLPPLTPQFFLALVPAVRAKVEGLSSGEIDLHGVQLDPNTNVLSLEWTDLRDGVRYRSRFDVMTDDRFAEGDVETAAVFVWMALDEGDNEATVRV